MPLTSSSFMLRGAVSALGAPVGSCRRVRRGASVAARAALSELKSTSVSLAKLSETGRVTKNVDGALLTRASAGGPKSPLCG